jgi:hypothetical protein
VAQVHTLTAALLTLADQAAAAVTATQAVVQLKEQAAEQLVTAMQVVVQSELETLAQQAVADQAVQDLVRAAVTQEQQVALEDPLGLVGYL